MRSTSRPACNKANRIRGFFCAAGLATLAALGGWTAFAADAPQTHTITIHAMKFDPAVLHIRHGDSIVFKNADFLPHTATAKSPDGFDSGMITPGTSWTVTRPAPGSIHYQCTYHPTMAGEIVVD